MFQAAIGFALIGSVVWIAIDAPRRDWEGNRFCDATWKWVLGSILLWYVAFPMYVIMRRRVPLKSV